jgi:hypothetical protein
MLKLAAGGLSGCASRTVLAPIDRVKILYQTNPQRPFKFAKAWKTSAVILRDEGVLGFYRGNGAGVLRVAPYAATIFTTFDMYEDALCGVMNVPHSTATRFCAGSAAGMTAGALTHPLDLLRTRIAATWGTDAAAADTAAAAAAAAGDSSKHGNGSVATATATAAAAPTASSAATATPATAATVRPKKAPRVGVWRRTLAQVVQESGYRGLYAGLWASLVGIVPYAGLNFAIYGVRACVHMYVVARRLCSS